MKAGSKMIHIALMGRLKKPGSFLALLLLVACTNNNNIMETKILSRQPIPHVPSASGIELVDSQLYAIGDNSPWLFKLDSQYTISEKWRIFSDEQATSDLIEKKDKPDFEAMTSIRYQGRKALLIFGSGSKLKKRSSLIWVSLGDSVVVQSYSLEKLYKSIIKKTDIGKDELNIEAAVAGKDKLYLLNRGTNTVICYTLDSFVSYIQSGGPVPELTSFKVQLPEVEGIEAGFSGATISPDSAKIIFTASVENTSNWIDDGKILGSFVGIIDLVNTDSRTPVYVSSISQNNSILNIKVESVAFNGFDLQGNMKVLLVTDSDGGISEILELLVMQNPSLEIK